MSYQALYRKYRPKDFSDVKGQDAIVTTLRNQLKSGRVGHAYLFCGTRGTGKTTVAKIFAKAMNCLNLTEDGPCGECERCKAIEDGSSMNVIEIDGASNNRVDDIRQILDEVIYSPADGGKKVYIIDEAHMVTDNAFNALLKTLEEPPEYLTFILATTDPQKIIPTIQSRCQRYDFKRIPVTTITDRLRELLDKEGVSADERALNYIARVSDGALRDALSLLEECISFYFGEELTFDKVLGVVGSVDQSVYHELTDSLIKGDVRSVVASVETLIDAGRDLTQFVRDYIWYLRNLMLVKTADDTTYLIDMSDENISILKEHADRLELEQIVRYIHVMDRLMGDIRHSANKRVDLEIALIRLSKPQMERDFDSLIDRMRDMERELDSLRDKLDAGVYSVSVTPSTPSVAEGTEPVESKEPKRILPEAVPEDIKEIINQWKHIEQSVQGEHTGRMSVALSKAILSEEDGVLVIGFKDILDVEYFSTKRDNLDELKGVIAELTGKAVSIKVKDMTDAKSRVGVTDLRQILKNVPIEEED